MVKVKEFNSIGLGRLVAALVILALLVPLYTVAAQDAGPDAADAVHLEAALSGAEEVPPANPEGTGTSHVFLIPETNEVCFTITVANITLPATAAHIHVGEAGVAGDVVVPLAPPGESGAVGGCTTGVDPAVIQAIMDNPAGYYVNVHNADFPDGVVRGQLAEAAVSE
jgi:hypothetical protein